MISCLLFLGVSGSLSSSPPVWEDVQPAETWERLWTIAEKVEKAALRPEGGSPESFTREDARFLEEKLFNTSKGEILALFAEREMWKARKHSLQVPQASMHLQKSRVSRLELQFAGLTSAAEIQETRKELPALKAKREELRDARLKLELLRVAVARAKLEMKTRKQMASMLHGVRRAWGITHLPLEAVDAGYLWSMPASSFVEVPQGGMEVPKEGMEEPGRARRSDEELSAFKGAGPFLTKWDRLIKAKSAEEEMNAVS